MDGKDDDDKDDKGNSNNCCDNDDDGGQADYLITSEEFSQLDTKCEINKQVN